jgi:hypothetical protein
MTDSSPPRKEPAHAKAPILDIGAGDPEAPANAIPNIIADRCCGTGRHAPSALPPVGQCAKIRR